MPSVLDPYSIRDLELRNRLWIAPMCQYAVSAHDGVPSDWHRVHYGSLAAGGTGLLVVEATGVAPEGRISPRDVGLWNEQQLEAWRPIVSYAHDRGAAIGVQLAHAGAKASTFSGLADERGRSGSVPIAEGGWHTVSSASTSVMGLAAPRALAADEVLSIVSAFVDAAVRADAAGFDLVEVHAAHGYLLHQFLSPLQNTRADAFGGDEDRRAALVVAVVAGIRTALPQMPIMVRFSASDWTDGGIDAEVTARNAARVIDAGADIVDASSGGLVRAKIPVEPGYQVPFAERIAKGSTPVSAVGLIETAEQAEAIVQSGQADAVRIARAALRNPNFPIEASIALGRGAQWVPEHYARAYPGTR